MRHRYYNKNGKVGHKVKGCLEGHFRSYPKVGTLFSKTKFLKQYAKWKPFVKDMRRMGFPLYAERTTYGGNEYVYIYAKKEDHPTDASFGTAVCITRYMYCEHSRNDRWLKMYLRLRKFYGVTRSVYLAGVRVTHISKPFTYLRQACKPRKRLDRSARFRQSGDSIFTYKSGFGSSINFDRIRSALERFERKPTRKNKKRIDSCL